MQVDSRWMTSLYLKILRQWPYVLMEEGNLKNPNQIVARFPLIRYSGDVNEEVVREFLIGEKIDETMYTKYEFLVFIHKKYIREEDV